LFPVSPGHTPHNHRSFDLTDLSSDKVRVVTASRDLGLHSRFAAAALGAFPRIIVHDDDLRLPPEGYKRLLADRAASLM